MEFKYWGILKFYEKIKRKTEGQAIFLYQSSVGSSCKWKFVICPFVDEETNGSYPFSVRLTALTDLPIYDYLFIVYLVFFSKL
jgi:hypothetical protein